MWAVITVSSVLAWHIASGGGGQLMAACLTGGRWWVTLQWGPLYDPTLGLCLFQG